MPSCTWKECTRAGNESQIGRTGEEWALLCDEHAAEMEKALDTLEPKPILRAWALARHGHQSREDFIRGVSDGAQAIGRFAQALKRKG